MKHIIIFFVTAVLMAFAPQNANGQFLKKLGKVLGTVDKAWVWMQARLNRLMPGK